MSNHTEQTIPSLEGRPFFNHFTRKMETSGKGHIFVTWKEGQNGKYEKDGERFEIDLGIGCVSDHHLTIEAARAFQARIDSKYPEVAGRTEIVLAPCAFARRDSWVTLA